MALPKVKMRLLPRRTTRLSPSHNKANKEQSSEVVNALKSSGMNVCVPTNTLEECRKQPILMMHNPGIIFKYRSLIGSANWIIILRCFDISYVVTMLARYSCTPQEGHDRALWRVFGYLKFKKKGRILIDVEDPPVRGEVKLTTGQNWSEVYPDAVEDLPKDMPEPKGQKVTITVYVDTDHACDQLTRRSVTGVLLLINNTPLQWVSKRQPTVETSTYGSELVATRVAVDMIVEVRYKLRMLGIPISLGTICQLLSTLLLPLLK
jgi:hypothetical protein